MTTEGNNNLEAALAGLTQWEGKATALWRRALRTSQSARSSRGFRWGGFMAWRPSKLAMASIVLGLVFVIAAIVNLSGIPSQSKRVGHLVGAMSAAKLDGRTLLGRDYAGQSGAFSPSMTVDDASVMAGWKADYSYQFQTSAPLGRQVIRKATVELRTEDIRAVFLKIQHVVRPADGEYVQDSALTGAGRDAQANLTLRVVSNRLGEVLNELRQFAEVVSESNHGQDVTAQVVDLDAGIRNEKRVEDEILELLQSRKEASLKDILDMREKLGEVRREIERMTGQRVQLNKLVSLATVLVIIRAKDAPQPQEGSLATYFGESIGAAWRGSLLFLADTLATMMRILVGGVVFWVLLAGGIWAVVRRRRRALANNGL